MHDLIGQSIDRYQVSSRLSDYPWGSTWKAYDPKFDRSVVLLILDSEWNDLAAHRDSILNASRIVLRFRHPGIARLLDIGTTGDTDFIVQEHLPGGTLADLMKNQRDRGLLPPVHQSVEVSAEICRAVDYIHQRSLVHGGISPQFIHFRSDSLTGLPLQPVIIHLGMSPQSFADSSSPYRAPEIVRGEPPQPGSDIFAIGVLLYDLLTGQTPVRYPFPRPSSLRPGISDSLENVMRKALSPDPALRYQNAGQMAADMEALVPSLRAATLQMRSASTAVEIESIQDVFRRSLPTADAQGTDSDTRPLSTHAHDLTRDQIHVLAPGAEVRTFNLRDGPLTIGRGRGSDIQIDQPGISRHHARLEFDGSDYRITDLHSTNGTFIEQKRLPPGEPTVWDPGDNVRIGEVWLRLESHAQSNTTRAFVAGPTKASGGLPETIPVVIASDGRSFEPGQILSSTRGWVGAYVDNPNLVATPGSGLTFQLMLFNRGPLTDTFHLSAEGLPAEWLASPLQGVSIPSNSDRSVALTLRPPRSSAGRAGRHQLILTVGSENARDQVIELRLSVTVTAYSEFFSELQSDRLRSGQIGQVLIHNRGNLPETFTVLWEDRLHEISFDPPQVRVTVPPGKTAAVEYRPALIQPRWLGSDTTHSYKIHVTAQTGQMQTHTGEYIGRALVPAWAPVGASALCVVLACLLLLLVNQAIAPARADRGTAQAGETMIAQATQIALDATPTTVATQSGILATLQAGTATAAWGLLDPDGDGLPNQAEILAGTRLDLADSDGDGLTDGEEVTRWKTNPLSPDSDGDLLHDAEEIRRGTNPLLRDTDGDGLDDGFDPDPVQRPTNTPLVIFTFTPRPPTLTPTPRLTSADLNISISNAQGSSTPGEQVAYSIQISNRGPGAASSVAVTSALPPNLISPVWTCIPAPGSNCLTPNGLGNVNARIDLPVGGVAVITVEGRISPNASGQITVTAAAAAPPGVSDSNPIDNQATDVDTLIPRAALTLTATDNRTIITAGSPTAYIIRVTNGGPSAVNGVNLMNTFPAGVTGVTWSCAASSGSSCSVSGVLSGNVNTMLNLAAGGSATVTANAAVRPNATGRLVNTAVITSPVDPLQNNKTVTDITTIADQSDLGISASFPTTASVSTPITYTLEISNTGPAPASAVEISTQFPPDVAFITYTVSSPEMTLTCNPATGRVVCELAQLPAGTEVLIWIRVMTPPLPGLITSVWDIRSPQTDPEPINNQVETVIEIVSAYPYPPYPPP